MIYTGLVSVTFRKLSPKEIVEMVKKAGLKGIEWGGDIHVPHGDVLRAREVSQMTQDFGLRVAAYGSYYKVGHNTEKEMAFERVLETAVALKAPTIRIWAGDRGSRNADEAWWNKVADESRSLASMSEKEGISISFEYHNDTLMDTPEAASRLLKEINHSNIRSYWQIPIELNKGMRKYSLEQIIPWLSNIHMYYYKDQLRATLADGQEEWTDYLEIIKKLEGEHFCMIEFVKNDNPQQFFEDASTLNKLLKMN